MFDPNNPNPTYQPGMMHTMNALAPGQMPMQSAPGQMPPQNALAMPTRPDRPMFDHTAFQALRGDPAAMQGFHQDYRSQLGDWRGLMDQYKMGMHDYRQQGHGGPMMTPGGGVGVPGTPGGPPNTQFPLNPQGMVGQSYGVQGMTPAASPFGLPTY